jgi:hypothetical protein
MAITQAIPNSFRGELLTGTHNFTVATNVFKLALYTSASTMSSATTSFSTTSEVANTGQYVTGGGVLTNVSPVVSSGVAFIDFNDISFTGVTLTAAGALIYNTSSSNKAVAVLSFSGDKTATAGTFTIQFPAATVTTAILFIS